MSRKKRRNGEGPERASEAGADGGRGAGGGLPAWLPAVVYGVVTLVLFRSFVFSDEMLWGSDTRALGYVARAFFADAVREHGVFPLWNPRILGGTPFLEALSGGDTLYPTSLLLFVVEPFRALGWKLILHVFLAGLFMYGWLRVLGRTRIAAFLGGLAYLMAPFMVTLVNPGHDGKLFVTALTPLLFWAAEASLVRSGLLGYVGVAAVVALVVLTTHYQMAYFLFGAVGVYYIFRCIQRWRADRKDVEPGEEEEAEASGLPGRRRGQPALAKLALFLGAAVVGAGVGAVQLVPSFAYVLEHSRRTETTVKAPGAESVAYSSSWSLHPEEVVATTLVPEFVGNSAGTAEWTRGTYWGRNPFKDNLEYVGVLVLLLAGLAFVGAPRPGLRWFFTGLGCVSLLYALGAHTPVWRIFYEVLPGVSLFRAPSIAIFLFGFSAVTLMGFGVDRGVELAGPGGGGEGWKRAATYLWSAVGLLGFLALLASAGILTELWTGLVYRDIPRDGLAALRRAEPFIVRGFWISTILLAAGAGAFWALGKGLLAPTGVAAILALGLLVDGLRIDDAFIHTFDFRRWAAPDANMEYLMGRMEAGERFRLVSLAASGRGQDVKPAMYGVELASGHHPNDLATYRKLIGMRGSGLPTNLVNITQEGRLYLGLNTFALLNARYLLWPDAIFGTGIEGLQPVSRVTAPDGRTLTTLYEMPGVRPRAWLVGRTEVLDDESAVARIRDPEFDAGTTAILPAPAPVDLPGTEVSGSVRWEEDGLNRMGLTVSADAPALLVLSENWYPAWEANVNGEEAPVLRADVALRAVPVPAGSSTVVLEYRSEVLRLGLVASLVSLLLLLGVGGYAYQRERRDRRI